MRCHNCDRPAVPGHDYCSKLCKIEYDIKLKSGSIKPKLSGYRAPMRKDAGGLPDQVEDY